MPSRYIKPVITHELYARSGNQCAFSGCKVSLFETEEDSNTNYSNICHIEGYAPNGPRYHPGISDDEVIGIDNLLLLCRNHHAKVDQNEAKYTVEVLKKMKHEHEDNVASLMRSISASVSEEELSFGERFVQSKPKIHKKFNEKLQKIFQKYNCDLLLLHHSFDVPFPEVYMNDFEYGGCEIRDLLNSEDSLSLSGRAREYLFSFTNLCEYLMNCVNLTGHISGSTIVPSNLWDDLDVIRANN